VRNNAQQEETMTDTLLTKAELAALLRVTMRTIDNYVKSKAIPKPVRVGRRALWHRQAIVSLLTPGTAGGGQ
jgi:predicted DNA-binding transcriptional regulator AlpA